MDPMRKLWHMVAPSPAAAGDDAPENKYRVRDTTPSFAETFTRRPSSARFRAASSSVLQSPRSMQVNVLEEPLLSALPSSDSSSSKFLPPILQKGYTPPRAPSSRMSHVSLTVPAGSEDSKVQVSEHVPASPATRARAAVQKVVTPANYDAVEIHGHFGMIHLDQGCYGEDHLILHASQRVDKAHMLSVRVGDEIPIVYMDKGTKTKRNGKLTVRYVTQSRYYSPGVPVTSVRVGVDGWEQLQS